MTGRIKFFSKPKGWGFIVGEDGRDYFVHNSAIVPRYKWTPQPDEQVKFDLDLSPKGLQAINVTKV